jgi:hypothetical protein
MAGAYPANSNEEESHTLLCQSFFKERNHRGKAKSGYIFNLFASQVL